MKKIRVCLDTNIFVSAFLFSGKPAELVDKAVEGKITLITSPQILSEISHVLRDKFSWHEQDIKRALKTLVDISEVVVPEKKINLIEHDPDNRVLEAAFEGRADSIVTGDKKHLLPLKNFKNIPIFTPNEFLSLSNRK